MAVNRQAQSRDNLFEVIKGLVDDMAVIKTELTDIRTKYNAHRHAAAGIAAAANTGPSTAAGTSEATQSSITAITAKKTTSE